MKCKVCAGGPSRWLFTGHGYPVWECRNCGLQYFDPQPDDATLSALYGVEYYFLGEPTPEGKARVNRLKRATAALYLDHLSARLGTTVGRLLEIGCGQGELLLEAQTRGFDVSGLEISPHSAAAANQRIGSEQVVVGTLDALDLPRESFDVVVFSDVLEHVRDPLDFLGRVHALLKPRGMVCLTTASLDSLSTRLMGRYWMEYKVEHLFYFGSRAIRIALRRSGFGEITVAPSMKVLSFDYIDRHFRRFPVPVITPLLRAARALMPERLAHRPLRLPASGMVATATKL